MHKKTLELKNNRKRMASLFCDMMALEYGPTWLYDEPDRLARYEEIWDRAGRTIFGDDYDKSTLGYTK